MQFVDKADQGLIVSVKEIALAYQNSVGHEVAPNQIYYVLKRRGWRNVMTRSWHPRKASKKAINTTK